MSSQPVRIACFGDSLTEGYGLHPDEALPVVLERLLRDDGIRVTCLNFGVSGDTAEDGLERLDSVLMAEPHCAVLEFGANDCFVGDPVPVVKANLTALISAFKQRDIPLLLVGITALTVMDDEYKAGFDPIFAELAEEHGVPLFPDILSCYFGDNALTLMDGMHPNEQGVEAIARELYPMVEKLVRSLG
ncbi:arylesterase [Pseudodesulfovibrio cashew]|uniref:Arylesterase n=1 Tax=Pseudodesulfovibrio cashew TaxID=2678688 RepID=A0A6I6JLB1_9BACT|nr:arylesterase [Pseudodesulfovibrio cashew]QGY40927.1 arylesterase [Pseudodesulfovibrio cashew]